MNAESILIVEDNQDLAAALKSGIEEEGYAVTIANSAEQAFAELEQSDFDLLFMDVQLPGMDGINAMTRILGSKPQTRVVVMSGYKIDTLLQEAMSRGAVSILQKPFSVEKALELIRSA